MENLLERFVNVPMPQKLAALGVLVAAMAGANYFLVIGDVEGQIERSQSDLTKLQKDLIDKQIIANNLNEYRRKKEQLEHRLQEALTELPNSKDIDELIRQLNDVGKKVGLDITSIEPGPESPEAFFARIPVRMSVSGNYHEIALFFESVARLRRIVNISGVSFTAPVRRSEKIILKADYLATTFRFIPPSEKGGAQPGSGR